VTTHYYVTTPGKLFTDTPLSPSSIIWYCSREGYHSSDVTLATSQWPSIYSPHLQAPFWSGNNGIIVLPPFHSCFLGKPGLASVPRAWFCSILFHSTLGIRVTSHVSHHHPTNSVKALKKHKALTPTRSLALSFLDPPPDSWWKGHCSLYAGSLMPVPKLNNNTTTTITTSV